LEEILRGRLVLMIFPGKGHQQVRVGEDHGKSSSNFLTSSVVLGSPTKTRRPFRRTSFGRALTPRFVRFKTTTSGLRCSTSNTSPGLNGITARRFCSTVVAGGLDYAVVSKAIARFGQRLCLHEGLRKRLTALQNQLSK
jgi:hypothetical protein